MLVKTIVVMIIHGTHYICNICHGIIVEQMNDFLLNYYFFLDNPCCKAASLDMGYLHIPKYIEGIELDLLPWVGNV